MKRAFTVLTALFIGVAVSRAGAHGIGAAPTWNREISRLVYDKCASCHRPGGTAFSLMTYLDAQPRGNEIKDAVLARRMPPWGAVKGFGNFRNDQSLTQEQVETFARWVDGGIRRGNNPRQLPKTPVFAAGAPQPAPEGISVAGSTTLHQSVVVDGLMPVSVPPDASIRIVAVLPNGAVEPLVWLHGYDNRFAHPFLFRAPLTLPAGSVIRGVPARATVALFTASESSRLNKH
jgi:hypothetical protein